MNATPAPHCENCGSPLYGEHCYVCGQPTRGLVRHFSTIIGDAADSLFDIDSRLMRTLPALLLKPGFLSREYFDGHRVRYVSPVRLFIFLCIATFFAAKLATPSFDFDDGSEAAPSASAAPTEAAIAEPPSATTVSAPGVMFSSENGSDLDINFDGEPWDADTNPLTFDVLPDSVNAWINAQISHLPKNWERVREDPDLLRNAFYSALPTALFVLVPVFALLLKLVYVFKRRLYMEHLVVALHGHAFVCAMLLVLMALSSAQHLLTLPAALVAALGWLEWLATLWIPTYLWLHIKRVYGQGVWMTSLKFGALALGELTLLSIVATLALLASLIWL